MPKTPPFGYAALEQRVASLEADGSETGERMARVETKVDIVIDLMRQEREDRKAAEIERGKTERARVGSRGKVLVAAVTAMGVVGAALARYL